MDSLEEVKESRSEGKRITKRYSYEVKLRAVKLYLEEGLPVSLLGKELGVKSSTILGWLKRYRARGEAGLRGGFGSEGAGGSFPLRYARRSSRSRSKSHFLESSGYPIF